MTIVHNFRVSLLSFMIVMAIQDTQAADIINTSQIVSASLPTMTIEAMDDGDPIKTYVDYKQANVTRNGLDKKDVPQTIDTIDVSKYKIYGENDLSVMLQGTPGVSTSYDMRGDGIMLRGFSADSGDIYRDGVRESGQVRRSTANVERIEILKGPASVLYGRSAGGGVINMVTKYANFDSKSSIGAYVGSDNNVGGTIDINQILNNNWAIRLVGEKSDTNSFRSGIGSNQDMLSPSMTYRSDDQTLIWTTEYTDDRLNRIPDRGPSYDNLPAETSIKMGFAQDNDYVDDLLKTARTDIKYEFFPNWKAHWSLSHREAQQNFDHFYLGSICTSDVTPTKTNKGCYKGYINQVYYWQQTTNKTTASTFDITAEFYTKVLKHNVLIGLDWSYEQREPLLSNKNSDGSLIYGFVHPLTGDRFNHRGTGHLITSHNYNEGTNYGIFLQDLISLNDKYKLMLGLRYDTYQTKTTNKLESSADYGASKQIKSHTVSPNIGFIWQPIPAHSLYASYSRSFVPFGGNMSVNVVSATTDLDAFNQDPQYLDQYEVGIKSDWLNEKFSTQFSAYHIKKHNIKGHEDPDDDNSPYIIIGENISKGAEFSFIGQIFDQLYLRGGYGYTDATISKNKRDESLVGNDLRNVSKNTGNLFIRYLPYEKLYSEVGVTYTGSYYTTDNNNLKMPHWTRIDTAIGYKDNHWGATFAVTNVANKTYWRSSAMPGTPRNYLFRINYFF
ncbi:MULTISPECIES: TonB-dependent receptor [unclassified Acinetobacter]|uniref:TonB-dependent receptor n=1 Tax=unclassified Acinetobacter TaxID=196816 RepID=UPI002934357B|nr:MULTISPECIES: TonB-dependent receptor [unclassified Acinetobacter]WOE31486.1 TonB-dependent receptor [Acinetobacter sp. SAAs470]WOE39682.1 TonB-dependent receptor [Acinetobacter sp. SAAs474]